MFFLIFSMSVFIPAGIYISLQDIRTFHLPLKIIYGAAFIILAAALFTTYTCFIKTILSALITFLFYYLIRKLKGNTLGMGDVHLAFLCGSFSGLEEIMYSSLCASLTGSFFILLFRIKKLPFAPFMIFSALVIKYFHIMKIPELLW